MSSPLNRYVEKAQRVLFAGQGGADPIDRRRIHLVSCIGADLEQPLVPHFLDHYLGLGVLPENFHVIVNSAHEQSDALIGVEQMLAERGIRCEERWIEAYTSAAMWQKRRDVQRRCVPKDHWVLSADTDEFHEYPIELAAFLGECQAHGINTVDGVFMDRVSADGSLKPVDASGPALFDDFPIQAMVQGRIADFGAFHQVSGSIKLMAFDAALLPDQGGHTLVKEQSDARFLFGRSLTEYPQMRHALVRFRVPLRVHHFKWHAALPDTLEHRLAQPNVSPAGREYGGKLLDYFARHHSGIALSDVATRHTDGWLPLLDWRTRVRGMRVIHMLRLSGARAKRVLRQKSIS